MRGRDVPHGVLVHGRPVRAAYFPNLKVRIDKMGSHVGSLRTAAKRLNLSLSRYLRLRSRGLKHCVSCGEWLEEDNFCQSANRYDGRAAACKACHNASRKAVYHEDIERSRKLCRLKDHRRAPARTEYRRRTRH